MVQACGRLTEGKGGCLLTHKFPGDTETCYHHHYPAISYPLGGRDTTTLPSSLPSPLWIQVDQTGAGPAETQGTQEKRNELSPRGEGHTTWLPGVGISPSPALCGAMLPLGPGVGGLGQAHLFLPPWQPVPPTSLRDEDLQLQLALRLSRQEHQKVAAEPPVLVPVLVEVLRGTNRLLPLHLVAPRC